MFLIYGQTGQVARELQEIAPQHLYLDRSQADFSRPETVAQHVHTSNPEAVIIAAAYTAVDKAEEERDLAFAVNAHAPKAIAEACAKSGIPVVFISTDYVFDGSGSKAFSSSAQTVPLNVYGESKKAGERAVRESGAPYAILRTSWVFSSFGNNFVKTMLRLGREREELSIVADQIGGPTPARAIAAACLQIADRLTEDPGLSGTYQFAGAPDVSWAQFARAIFEQAGLDVAVSDIPASQFPTPAKRPANSRMDCSDLTKLGLSRPDWSVELKPVIEKVQSA